MRKKSGFTIVEQAIVVVPDSEKAVRKLDQQVTLHGQTKIRRFGINNHTTSNYSLSL